ncbi:MAG: pyruvate flavodoxin/ferredoxin oxidoreductase [Desulfobacterales bacterium]
MAMVWIDGNEALARGAVAAGCRFFAGYPITPATSILNHMLALLPPAGGICLQGEDEIASIGFCIGASMAGLRAMTATSGPGISLYSEQISFAVGSEIPLVIVDVQRLGPSTGSATRGADGDIQFLQWGNSGGLPVVVYAPVDAADCFRLVQIAFRTADALRTPVFIASNKEIALTRESLDEAALAVLPPGERPAPPAGRPYLPFETPEGVRVPPFLPIGGGTLVRQTSSTHGADGYITTDPAEITRMLRRMQAKIETAAEDLAIFEHRPAPGADTLLVTYGVTSRAAAAACRTLARRGAPVAHLVLKTLWPVPAGVIRQAAEGLRRIVVVEMNLGQYVREIERVLPGRSVAFVGQMDGRLIAPETILEAVLHG